MEARVDGCFATIPTSPSASALRRRRFNEHVAETPWTVLGKLPRVNSTSRTGGCNHETQYHCGRPAARHARFVRSAKQGRNRGHRAAPAASRTAFSSVTSATSRSSIETHLIVYVGSQRCAFHVELRGTFCDLTFAPELYFRRSNEVPDRTSLAAGRHDSADRIASDDFDPLELAARERRDLRICSERPLGSGARRPLHGIAVGTRGRTASAIRINRLPRVERHLDYRRSARRVLSSVVESSPPLPPMGDRRNRGRRAGRAGHAPTPAATPTRSRRNADAANRTRATSASARRRASGPIARLARRVVFDRAPASAT